MKLFFVGLVVANASAFTVSNFGAGGLTSSRLFAEGYAAGSSRINTLIDLESPKVVNQETLKAGEKKVYCRCWKSGTFPLCDAAHVKHNEATGDNVGPLIVSCAKEE